MDIASTYQQISEAEKQASKLELMLDSFEAKLDSILQDAENINTAAENVSGREQQANSTNEPKRKPQTPQIQSKRKRRISLHLNNLLCSIYFNILSNSFLETNSGSVVLTKGLIGCQGFTTKSFPSSAKRGMVTLAGFPHRATTFVYLN